MHIIKWVITYPIQQAYVNKDYCNFDFYSEPPIELKYQLCCIILTFKNILSKVKIDLLFHHK